MFDWMVNLGAFVVALGILVAVHEWGHFYVARLCGVHVERFSVGFGKPLWRRTDKKGTEFVVAAIPLGGYVRMLDERVDNVPADKRQYAFNNKPVLQRMAIIAAGPGVNFIFAVFALMLMFMLGVTSVKPVVGDVTVGSIAERSGIPPQSEIIAVNNVETPDWQSISLELMSAIGQSQIEIRLRDERQVMRTLALDIRDWSFDPDKISIFESLGIVPFRPTATMTLAVVAEGSAAQRAGLQTQDVILAIDDEPVQDWQRFSATIAARAGDTVILSFLREGQTQQVSALIGTQDVAGEVRGVLGVSPVFTPWPEEFLVTQQYGVFASFARAAERTWRLMTLTLEMLGKLIVGDVSVKNLSGPISIAQGAGASASVGLVYFLSFLALISVNLGVINLLPLPMLDGGHLMYYTFEWLTGKPVPLHIQEWGFRFGATVLMFVMLLAIMNDISRLL